MKLIGLKSILKEIDDISQKSYIYNTHNIKPANIMIRLDRGNGRTTILDYISDVFKQNKIIEFLDPDSFIEITMDGSAAQFRKSECKVKDAAVYDNNYAGIIGIDCIALATHQTEPQYIDFFNFLKKISKYAFIVIFIPEKITKTEEKFINKIDLHISNIKHINAESYSVYELMSIFKQSMHQHNIHLNGYLGEEEDLCNIISINNITTAKEAYNLVNDIIFFAEISDKKLILGKEQINSYILEYRKREYK